MTGGEDIRGEASGERTPPPDDGASVPTLPSRFHRHATGDETTVIEVPQSSGEPPAPPPDRRKRQLLYGGIGLLVAFAVGIGLLAAFSARSGDTPQAVPTVPSYTPPPEPADCIAGTPGEDHPDSGLDIGRLLVAAGDLPAGWQPSDEALPFATRAQLVTPPDGGAAGGTGTVFGLVELAPEAGDDLRAIADAFLACLIHAPRYDGTQPLPANVADAQTHDAEGTEYLSLTARVIIGGRDGTGGDGVFLVVIDSAPRTMAVGIAPLGEPGTQDTPASQAAVLDVLKTLRIRSAAPAGN